MCRLELVGAEWGMLGAPNRMKMVFFLGGGRYDFEIFSNSPTKDDARSA